MVMFYPSERVKVEYRNKPAIMVDSCLMCGRYAEHFSTGWELTKCRYCDFAYSEYVHYVMLPAYGKIQSARIRENRGILLKHALKEHPFHFAKKKIAP